MLPANRPLLRMWTKTIQRDQRTLNRTVTASKSRQKPIQNKKRQEMICEQSQTRSNEIVFMNPDEPVLGNVPASVENGVVTPVSPKANTTNSEPLQEALQGGEQLMEQKNDQQQSAAFAKCSSKNSLPQFMTAVEAKSPPASPTSRVFRLLPNPEAVKTPLPAVKRGQSKVSPPANPVKQIPPTGKLPTVVDGRPTLIAAATVAGFVIVAHMVNIT